MRAMADPDELAALRAHLKRIERRQAQAAGDADRMQRLLLARLLIVIATVALFLALSMPWYADFEVQGEDAASASGWRVFLSMINPEEGDFVVGGLFCWAAVLIALVSGASAFTLRRRWFAGTVSALLVFLAVLLLALNMRESEVGEKLAGIWCSIAVMVGGAFAWGNLVTALREEETAALYDGGRSSRA
jgi:hypothetical protein